jgi:hypothetical protein
MLLIIEKASRYGNRLGLEALKASAPNRRTVCESSADTVGDVEAIMEQTSRPTNASSPYATGVWAFAFDPFRLHLPEQSLQRHWVPRADHERITNGA